MARNIDKVNKVLEKNKRWIVSCLIEGLKRDAITKLQAGKIAKAAIPKFQKIKKVEEVDLTIKELTDEFVELRVLVKFVKPKRKSRKKQEREI